MLYIKRLCDLVFGCVILVALLPVLAVIGACIAADSRGGIFFVQDRVGKNRKMFKIYKFRTMVAGAVNMGSGVYTEENDPRITRVGRFLRKTSLDELPQIFNIVRGDMSFIGPRPTLLYQVEQYDDFQMLRLKMRPGVTGWAQVNGRNSISWPERIKFDVWYIENWSLRLDARIWFKTALVLFKREGIYGKKENFVVRDKSSLNV